MSQDTSNNNSAPQYHGQNGHTSPLTRENLDRIPARYVSNNVYTQQGQNHEQLAMGLQTGRRSGRIMVGEWEERWRKAGNRDL
ncbi:hypothetical protein BDZ45DRAFT_750369 [Acephala macrosclerotiorum]|nr:hypothetical protein BDZ45DRAFT_750369 [Acephala macrosclerotiorum]